VGRAVARFTASRHYLISGLTAFAGAVISLWWGFYWQPAFIPGAIFTLFSAALLGLYFGPAIEIHETHLKLGRSNILWRHIRRLDRTGWVSPLALHLTLEDGRRVLVIYPGDPESANSLLRQMRRCSREALIDGIPYRQFWGEVLPAAPPRKQLPAPKYPLLRPEDEAEVERLFQRLKAVGHFDAKSSADEK
jgi:hypothetical protein